MDPDPQIQIRSAVRGSSRERSRSLHDLRLDPLPGLSSVQAHPHLEEREIRELELVVLLSLERTVEVKDIGDDIVQEDRVMQDDKRHAGREARGVVLEPRDVHNVQVVGGRIKQEGVRAAGHNVGERELHP